MEAETCPFSDCEEPVRIRYADEMPTLVPEDGGDYKTVFDVKFCDAGHVIKYIDRQVPMGASGTR